MEEKKHKNAKEFIDREYDKFFGDRDLSRFPKTLTQESDMRYFAMESTYRDLYDVIIADRPFLELEGFYCQLEDRNKGMIKNGSFVHAETICEEYQKLCDLYVDCSEEVERTVPIEGEPKDSTELEIVSYIDLQYNHEVKRIIDSVNAFIEKAKEIISSIDSISDDELDKRQVELLILLEDMKDTGKVEPEALMDGALNIYHQLQVNVLEENVVKKLCDAYEQ